MSDNATPIILLTRPRAAADRFAAACVARFHGRAQIVVAPLMEIAPKGPLPDLSDIDGLIFTAEPGVTSYARLSARRDLPAFCVGDRTAEVAAEIGLSARSANGTVEELLKLIAGTVAKGARMLHLHGVHTRGDLVARLHGHGIAAQGIALYDQHALSPDAAFTAAMRATGPIIVPVFSPRSATLFAAAAGRRPAHARGLAISHAVRDALSPDWRAATDVAEAPSASAMLAALADLI